MRVATLVLILAFTSLVFAHADEPANPWMNLRVTRALPPSSLLDPSARALSLASADFDEDGMPDLVTGYETPGGGTVVLRPGNMDAVYSHNADAPSFLPASAAAALPEAPDLLGAGDFNADGHFDVVSVRKGSDALYWLPGDGKGGFGSAQRIDLAGSAVSMICGEINRVDGLADVIVGVEGKDGSKVLVFEAPDGALQRKPEEISVPAAPTALAFGRLDDSLSISVAAAIGTDVAIIHGRDRKLTQLAQFRNQVAQPVTEMLHIGTPVTDLQAGSFSQTGQDQLALLTSDGQIRILNRDANEWKPSRHFSAPSSAGAGFLVKSWTAPLPWQSLIASDAANRQLVMPANGHETAAFPLQGKPVAVLPMRLNRDPLSDLVVLEEGRTEPVTIITAPTGIFTVTNTNDSGAGSLRQAINDANGSVGLDAIWFNIPGAGVHTIAPLSLLTPITDTVILDGTSQPGSSTGVWPPTLQIELNMTSAGPIMTNQPVLITGLIINRVPPGSFNGYGIYLQSSVNSIIQYNLIGTDATGTIDLGNGEGIAVEFAANNNLIGGTTPGARNLVSGNNGGFNSSGIRIQGNGAQNPYSNTVQGNYIGTDVTGTLPLPNNNSPGILLMSTLFNTIGGTTPGAGNVISGGHAQGGINLNTSAPANLIAGNFIGVNATGTAALGNDQGILIFPGILNTTIGGTTGAARNLISGNSSTGIVSFGNTSTGSLIQGNFIGTNALGSGSIPNYIGIQSQDSDGVIGGNIGPAGNLISGNGYSGMILSTGAKNLQVLGNRIGTDASGTAALANTFNGIYVYQATNTFIGGTSPGEGNVIGFNGALGVVVEGTSADGIRNRILGNSIFSNGSLGIDLASPGGPYGVVTPNDTGDADGGANNFQNFPVITSVTYATGVITVSGTLNSEASKIYTLEFFANQSCDVSGNGEGKIYLGNATVTTDGSGNASFTQTFAGILNPGDVITSTATDPAGNTSEFSACACYSPAVTAVSNSPQCAGSTIGLGAVPQVFDNYYWTGPNGWFAVVPDPIIANAQPLNSGVYTLQAWNTTGCVSQSTVGITVNPLPTVSPASLPGGTVGVAYNQTVTASSGTGPYTYSVTSGALPAGLTLNASTGAITGTPSTSGTSAFTISAADANGCSGGNSYVIEVACPAITIAPVALPGGIPGVAYNQTLTASGGAGPYTYSLTSGALPAGLTLNASTGAITGTPSAPGAAAFAIRATDANGCSGSNNYVIDVACPTITVAPLALPDGLLGATYNQVVTASGGTGPYTFALTQGSLPPGLSLSAGGSLTGTPTAAGSFAFHVTATDAGGCTGGHDYQVNISCSTISIAPPTLPAGAFGVPYSQALTASGGAGPYTFTSSGTLPPGVSMNAAGLISGTPTASGVYSFVATATDSNNCSADRTYILLVYTTVAAIPDTYTADQDTPLVVPAGSGVLANDSDQENGSPLSAMLITNPAHGSLILNADGSFTYTPNAGFTGADTFTYRATDGVNESLDTQADITVQAVQSCLFADDFSAGAVDPLKWSIVKPAWTQPSGELVGTPAGKTAVIIGTGFAGCNNCTIDTTMKSDGGIGNKVWLKGWYIDKHNDVELLMKEESNKWILKYRSGGKILAKTKALLPIDPGVAYQVSLSYDGAAFHLILDGTEVATLAVSGVPAGTAGYQVKLTTGHFDLLCVH